MQTVYYISESSVGGTNNQKKSGVAGALTKERARQKLYITRIPWGGIRGKVPGPPIGRKGLFWYKNRETKKGNGF